MSLVFVSFMALVLGVIQFGKRDDSTKPLTVIVGVATVLVVMLGVK